MDISYKNEPCKVNQTKPKKTSLIRIRCCLWDVELMICSAGAKLVKKKE